MESINVNRQQNVKPRGLFKNVNFLLLFSGRLVSQLGDSVYLFAIVWYILVRTGSAAQTGILMTLGMLPLVILGPFAGVVVDRVNRKNILVSMDLVRGVIFAIMGVMISMNNLPMWVIYTGTVLMGICASFFTPACTSAIPNIVDEDDLTQANSLDSIAVNSSQIIGVMLGALLYSWVGIVGIFFINAASFVISGITEAFIKLEEKQKVEGNFLTQLKEGFNYLLLNKGLLTVFISFVAINFLLAPILEVYLPYIFNKILKATASQLSYVRVSLGVGMVIGAIISSALPKVEKNYKRLVRSIFLFSVSFFCFAVPIFPGLRTSLSLWIIVITLIVVGVATGVFYGMLSIALSVIFQKEVEDSFRGRVTALMMTFGIAATPLGYLIGGFITEKIPIHIILLLTAGLFMVVALVMSMSKSLKTL